MAWKTAKSRKWKKMKIEMEDGPKLDRGKNGKKKAKEWIFEGVFHYFPIFLPCFLPFLPLSSLGPSSISISIFFHFRLLAVFHAIPARQDPKSRSKISIPVFLFAGPSWCAEKGSVEHFNPRSIARNVQSRRPRPKNNFGNPRALWGLWLRDDKMGGRGS